VYLPAAYETRSNAERRPERGSHAPGTFFYYNNWDFNVLSTIVEKESGEPFFETFTKRIAGPLEFEDFDPLALYLRYEPEKSQHAAYLMRLSARDMARVGVLYLHDGAWRGRQIVDADWVRRSGEHFSRMTGDFAGRGWYGHLWWAQDIAGEPAYYASGAGGQRMFVIPSRDLVVVVLFDTYGRGGGRHADTIAVATRVVEAATGDPSPSPRTSPYVGAAPTIPARHPLDDAVAKHVVGAFSNPKLGDFEFEAGDGAYVVTCGIGHFRVVPTGPHTAWAEDVECDVDFADDPQSDERQLAVSFDAQGRVDALRATW
jgi:CubicO group peptidase (beta-lactamase class C family)